MEKEMIFASRQEAGQKLALLLLEYKNKKETIVLGFPRGGVVTAYEVAKTLHLPLDVFCSRKIGAPFNPELAIGAVTETSECFFNQDLIEGWSLSDDFLKKAKEREEKIAKQRALLFRNNQPLKELKGKWVILVDDGLATGATMKASIQSMRKKDVKKVIVAIPVAPVETLQEMKTLADLVVCLHSSSFFQGVGQFYENFSQVEDEEVIHLLKDR